MRAITDLKSIPFLSKYFFNWARFHFEASSLLSPFPALSPDEYTVYRRFWRY
jgi:hypothetical protein